MGGATGDPLPDPPPAARILGPQWTQPVYGRDKSPSKPNNNRQMAVKAYRLSFCPCNTLQISFDENFFSIQSCQSNLPQPYCYHWITSSCNRRNIVKYCRRPIYHTRENEKYFQLNVGITDKHETHSHLTQRNHNCVTQSSTRAFFTTAGGQTTRPLWEHCRRGLVHIEGGHGKTYWMLQKITQQKPFIQAQTTRE